MIYRAITLAIVCLISNFLFGQKNEQKFYKWAFHSNLGYAKSFNNLKSGHITDYLIDYNDEYFYWQFLSVEYFFIKNFGLSLSIQGNAFTDADQRGVLMDAELEERFGAEYFISTTPYSYGQSVNINTSFYLGLVYAKRFKKISFLPKIQVGTTSFLTNRLNVFLKEMGANDRLQIAYSFSDDRRPKDNFTIMTGIMTEFNLSKNLTLDFNIQSYFFRTKFKYKEEIRNTYTEEKTFREFDYYKSISTLSVGLGIGYKL